jgi:predicted DNA-binding transcriptional regulator AlpA
MIKIQSMPKTHTTTEAAKAIGVSRQTLFTWIEAGLVVAPKPVEMGARSIRFWTASDIARVKTFRGTLKPGVKKRGAK